MHPPRRPVALWFIAAWCGLGMFWHVSLALELLLKAIMSAGRPVSLLVMYLPLGIFLVACWAGFGLLFLRRAQQWFCVAFLYWWILANTWLTVQIIFQSPTTLLRPAVAWVVFTSLSLASIWYLSRRSFLEFGLRYVQEERKTAEPQPEPAGEAAIDKPETTPGLRGALCAAFVQQFLGFLFIAAGLHDLMEVTLYAFAAFLAGTLLVATRRGASLTKIDLMFVRIGSLPVWALSFFLTRAIWKLRGY